MPILRWTQFFFLAAAVCLPGIRPSACAADAKDKRETASGLNELKFTAFDNKAPKFWQEVRTKTTQLMFMSGQEVHQIQEQSFTIEWTPKGKDKDGNFVAEQKTVGIKMNIDIGGNKISYDSALPEDKQPKNPMTDFFGALQKQKLTFIIRPDMTIKDIRGREKFVKELADTNPAIKGLLDSIMSQDALTKMAEPTWWVVPGKPVRQGEKWKKKNVLNLGPIGTYETTFDFTYEGRNTDKLDKIKIAAEMQYRAPKDKKGLPFTIKAATLTGKGGNGEALFNRVRGRVESSKLTMKLSGKLTIEVNDMETEVVLTQEQTSTTRTFDDNPLLARPASKPAKE
jgi:hypothetical protein